MNVNTIYKTEPRRYYRLSFIINTVVGGFLMLLAVVAAVLEQLFPALRPNFAFHFLWPSLICWFVASLSYAKHLSLPK